MRKRVVAGSASNALRHVPALHSANDPQPHGDLTRYHRAELERSDERSAWSVAKQGHEGSTFVVTFEGGSTVRINRTHAAAP